MKQKENTIKFKNCLLTGSLNKKY